MPDHNLNRLASIIAEIVTTLGIDVGDCNMGPGPDICALGDEAVATLKYRIGSTPSGRAEELIADLEAEIAKRDARIVELEAAVEYNRAPDDAEFGPGHPVFELAKENDGLRAALKAQPSAGVVLPNRMNPSQYDSAGSTGLRQGWNACLDEVTRLNPCRAQAVPDGWVDIAERLPEIGRHCLIKIPVCGRHEIEGATYEGDGVWASAWCSSRGRDCTYKVSHWMAAPSAQKESE